MPDPTGQDEKDKGLPLDFYGKSYLGKDVHVGVQGEGPTASAAGATPTGALGVGPTGSGPGPTSATGGAASSVAGEAGGGVTALQGLSLAQNVEQLAKLAGSQDAASGATGLDFGPGTNLTATLPEGQAALTGGGVAGVGGGAINVADSALTATLPAGQAALTSGGAAAGLNTGTGTSLTAGGETVAGGAEVAGGTAASGTSALGAAGLGLAGVNAGLLVAQLLGAKVPPIVTDIAGLGIPNLLGAIFGGPPPAISFPMDTWTTMAKAVNKNLPPSLDVPANASTEQRSSIEAANKLIEDIRSTYGGAPPPSLGGQQSAETWQNVASAYGTGVKKMFKDLQGLYPAAYQAANQAPVQTLTPEPPAPAPASEGSVLPPGFFEDEEKKKVAA